MAIATIGEAQRAVARAVVNAGVLNPMSYEEVAERSGVSLGHVRTFLDQLEGLARHVNGQFSCGPEAFHFLQAIVQQPLEASSGSSPVSIALTGNHNVVQASGRNLDGTQTVTMPITYGQVLDQLQQKVNESDVSPEKKRDALRRIAEIAMDKVIAPILGAAISKHLGE